MTSNLKACTKCKIAKPISEFARESRASDGFHWRCRLCSNAYKNSWAANNSERLRAKRREYAKAHPERLKAAKAKYQSSAKGIANLRRCLVRRRLATLGHYSGGVAPFCACCGETTLEFLCLDHIHGGGAKERRAANRNGNGFYRWLEQRGYPEGYQVLCHNCNMAKGAYGECPHKSGRSLIEDLND